MKIAVVFGTRPEAIKLAPVIHELRRRSGLDVRVVTTAQHRELVDQILTVFDITPDIDLDVMRPGQALADLSSRVLTAMDELLSRERPDLVVVQGDTTTVLMCALAAFYRRVRVAHVEAGLRTDDAENPFPEEMNRRVTSVIASMHFAPTARARTALLQSGVPDESVFITGNPVVDALHFVRRTDAYRRAALPIAVDSSERLVLVTLHRRESWGAPLAGMCDALRRVAERFDDTRIVIPVHLNPAVRSVIHDVLGATPRVSLVEPLDYVQFVALMDASWLVVTDSGGVQEEAPALGKPVLVLRETTERPEAVEEGVAELVGTDPDAIIASISRLLTDPAAHARMARRISPFGDGHAAERIADLIAARPPSRSMNVTAKQAV